MADIDRRLSELASANHGLVTKRQALVTGLGRGQIQYRLDSGRWDLVAPGVYRLAGAPQTWRQRALAACLGAPNAAVTTYLTGAAIHRLHDAPPPVPEITVPTGFSTRLAIAHVHRARLAPTDWVVVDGIPVTTVARTLIDCASVLGPKRLQLLVDEAFHRGLVTERSIRFAWDQARIGPGRAGEVKLRAAVEPWATTVRAGSPGENRLRMLVVQWGFPEPDLQVPILDAGGAVVARADVGWADRRVGLEYDGSRFHGPSAWTADLVRHRTVEGLGWTLLHADRSDLHLGAHHLRSALDRALRP